jgi:tight adherence protein B
MAIIALVLVVLGLGLVGMTVTAESLRRQRLRAFFANEPPPTSRDLVVTTIDRLPVSRSDVGIVAGAVAAGVLIGLVSASAILGAVVAIVVVAVPLAMRGRTRRREMALLRGQMADGLTSIASSMSAGSSFLRSLYELSAEARPPLATYLDQVMNEIEVGVSPSDAFTAMAARSELEPAAWLAHLLRVQESTGAPLVGLLERLADHVKQGDGIQREVRALTAEGRMSAYVIAALPAALVVLLELTDPGYLDLFTQGWGIVVAVGMAVSIAAGLALITRMVDSVEV